MACKALDDQVAVPTDPELRGLLDEFVCVRLVQMHGVDLSRFEFDGALTWAVFLMNQDGTIYGRYGSRSGLQQLSEREISVAGFKLALRGALDLHARHARDPEQVSELLAGKLPSSKPRWPTPEEIPSLALNTRLNLPFLGQPGTGRGCIHCHMVATHELLSLRGAGEPIPDRKFFPFPLPDALGMHMDPEQRATVGRVQPESIAARAGLRPGDRIAALQGQPILSTADIQWVLHNAGDEDDLEARVERGQDDVQQRTLTLVLPDRWREGLSDWRFINPGLLRQVVGFNVKPVPRRQARAYGLEGKLALQVDRTTRELRLQTGLGNLDLIVAVDGKREPLTVGALTAYVLREKEPGSTLTVTIMEIVDRFPRPEHELEVPVK